MVPHDTSYSEILMALQLDKELLQSFGAFKDRLFDCACSIAATRSQDLEYGDSAHYRRVIEQFEGQLQVLIAIKIFCAIFQETDDRGYQARRIIGSCHNLLLRTSEWTLGSD